MNKVTIGKYTLESLTTGMYIDPYVLYREYIQNAADSIDKAVKEKIITKKDGKINISLLKEKRTIEIWDNGTGIKKKVAYKVLTDIGNSSKKSEKNKGFRGIGRLSGLGYCEKLIFETSHKGENIKTIVTFDGLKLQDLLSPGKYADLSLGDVILKASEVQYQEENKESHYFKVIMVNVNKKLKLLEFNKVLMYLQETLPVPYNEDSFEYGRQINKKIKELGQGVDEYNIYLHGDDCYTKIFKPYSRIVVSDIKNKELDEIKDIEVIIIKDDLREDKLVSLVWYGKSSLKGTIVDESIKGLRIRKSGILIGDRALANPIFKEDRFNGWIIGEVLVFDDELIPNARRDDFEKNDAYLFFLKELKKVGEKISNEIRNSSNKRNKDNKKNIGSNIVRRESIFDNIDKLITEIDTHKKLMRRIEYSLNKNLDKDTAKKILLEIINE